MTERLKFKDEIETVKTEARNLKHNLGVDIVIVLSHCGIKNDREIAKHAGSDISIIVGGHSHTFLYTGDNPPGHDIPVDTYPITVTQADGHQVLIVHASCFSKYLGDITVYFDEENKAIKWTGNPIYLDSTVPKGRKCENIPKRNMLITGLFCRS
jgi:5'-nucleotidase